MLHNSRALICLHCCIMRWKISRRKLLKNVRNVKADMLASKLWNHISEATAWTYWCQTGRLFRSQNLKKKGVPEHVKWLLEGSGRFYTRATVTLALRKFLMTHSLQPLRSPEESLEQWISRQASLIIGLARKAKKCRGLMDQQDTQLDWDVEVGDAVHVCNS